MSTKEEAEFKRWSKTHMRELELEQTEAKMEEIYKKQDEKQITLCELHQRAIQLRYQLSLGRDAIDFNCYDQKE